MFGAAGVADTTTDFTASTTGDSSSITIAAAGTVTGADLA